MKGRTLIELTDVNTGEVTRIEDCNMFTNALDSIFNKAPYWFNNFVLGDFGTTNNTIERLTPVYKTALGGLLLFPENIEEDANIIYAPANNKPTGIASFDAYSGTDTRRGSLNEVESGPITNGYKYVWDFTTSQANGAIKCACLTSRRGGLAFYDDASILKDSCNYDQMPVGMHRTYGQQRFARTIGLAPDGVYFIHSDNNNIYRVKSYPTKLDLVTDSYNFELAGVVDRKGTSAIVGNELWIIVNSGNATGNATLSIDKYNLATWTKTTETLTVSAQVVASRDTLQTCVSNGYLYLIAYNQRDLYKVNLSNVADVSVIPGVITRNLGNDRWTFVPFNGGVLSREAFVESDDTIHRFNLVGAPVGAVGPWLITTNQAGDWVRVGATIISPYLATINNMQSDGFVKLPTQTMKVTYTVTEES